jgi:hypothetical protein
MNACSSSRQPVNKTAAGRQKALRRCPSLSGTGIEGLVSRLGSGALTHRLQGRGAKQQAL